MGERSEHRCGIPLGEEATFEGFDIPINEDHRRRIDRLIDDYEQQIVAHVNEEYQLHTTWSARFADSIATFGGSWRFIIFFLLFLVAWMIWNLLAFTKHFDPSPFILLNLILSCLAAIQAPVIMMSQNRQAARDKHESVISFAINYKAEQEIDDVQGHLHRIEQEMGEIRALLKALKEKTPPK